MALIDCVECGKQVSDQAASCPHCVAPVQLSQKKKGEQTDVTQTVAVVVGLIPTIRLKKS